MTSPIYHPLTSERCLRFRSNGTFNWIAESTWKGYRPGDFIRETKQQATAQALRVDDEVGGEASQGQEEEGGA